MGISNRVMSETEPSVELQWLGRTLRTWRAHEALPDSVPMDLDPLLNEAMAFMAPCGQEVAMVLLERLFSALPRPLEDAMPDWLNIAAGFPYWALNAGVDHLIRSHTYGRAPLPGELVKAIDSDPVYARRRMVTGRIETAAMMRRLQRREQLAIGQTRARPTLRLIAQTAQQMAVTEVTRPEITEEEFQVRRQQVLDACEAAGMVPTEDQPA